MLVSNCCGAENRMMADFGSDYKEAEICPRCKEHCEFVDEDERDDIPEDLFTQMGIFDPQKTLEQLNEITQKIKS